MNGVCSIDQAIQVLEENYDLAFDEHSPDLPPNDMQSAEWE